MLTTYSMRLELCFVHKHFHTNTFPFELVHCCCVPLRIQSDDVNLNAFRIRSYGDSTNTSNEMTRIVNFVRTKFDCHRRVIKTATDNITQNDDKTRPTRIKRMLMMMTMVAIWRGAVVSEEKMKKSSITLKSFLVRDKTHLIPQRIICRFLNCVCVCACCAGRRSLYSSLMDDRWKALNG